MPERFTAAPHGAVPVRLEGVVKRFGPVVAVGGVTLDIPAGKLVTLLGPSGCGKTTTLRMVAGLEQPSAGRIYIGDEDVTVLPASNRSVTMVFQSYALFPHLTVFENVAYGLRIMKVPPAAMREQVAAALTLVGLPQVGARYPAHLSGGQQQRVAIARALINEPTLLLADEPVASVDEQTAMDVLDACLRLNRERGSTLLMSLHQPELALRYCPRIIVLASGTVVYVTDASRAVGVCSNLLSNTTRDSYVAELKADYQAARDQHEGKKDKASYVSLEEARKHGLKTNWSKKPTPLSPPLSWGKTNAPSHDKGRAGEGLPQLKPLLHSRPNAGVLIGTHRAQTRFAASAHFFSSAIAAPNFIERDIEGKARPDNLCFIHAKGGGKDANFSQRRVFKKLLRTTDKNGAIVGKGHGLLRVKSHGDPTETPSLG